MHDAQYLRTDMPLKRGWGHSVIDDVFRLGALSHARKLVLFHHDPERTDDALDRIQSDAEDWFATHARDTQGIVAREGMTLDATR